MTDSSYLGKNPDFNWFRDRKLSQKSRQTPLSPEEVPPERYASDSERAKVFEDAEKVAKKAQRLLGAMDESFKNVCVSVPEHAMEVRASLARLDLPIDKICYPTYRNALDKMRKQAVIKDPLALIDQLTGHELTDNHLMDAQKEGTDSFDKHLKHIGVIAMLVKMIQGFSQYNNAPAITEGGGAGAHPPLATMLTQMAMSLGSLAVVDGQLGSTKDILENTFELGPSIEGQDSMLADPFNNMDKLEGGPATKAAMRGAFEDADWDTVQGYYATTVNQTDIGPQPLLCQTCDKVNDDMFSWSSQKLSFSPTVKLPRDLYELFREDVDVSNNMCDEVFATLNFSIEPDYVCCMMLFLENFSAKDMRQMRGLLDVVLNGLSLKLNPDLNALNNMSKRTMRDLITKMMAQLRGYADAFLDPLIHELTTGQEEWKKVFICIPIEELVEFITDAIEYIQEFILKLFEFLWDDVDHKYSFSVGIGNFVSDKRLRQILKLLDRALSGDMTQCLDNEDDPILQQRGHDTLKELTKNPFDGSGLMPPAEIEDPYTEFNPVTLEAAHGFTISSAQKNSDVQPDGGIPEMNISDCAKRLVGDNITKFQDFASFIKRESNNVQRDF